MSERILVVDDEESIAFTLSALLERQGYQTLSAGSLDAALACLDADRFDAVLLDLTLADADGLQLLARLHATAPDTAAIILTGQGTLSSATRAIHLGVSEYLTKPCPVDDLMSALSRALDKRRAILGTRRAIEEERSRLLLAERRARSDAEDAHRRLRELFLAAPALVAVSRGPTHVIEIANDQFLAAIGRAGAEAPEGRPAEEAFPELRATGFLDIADRVYQSGQPFVDPALPARFDLDGDGFPDRRWTSLTIQPYRDSDGNVAGLLLHGFDVTQRILTERRQSALAKLSGELAVAGLDRDEVLGAVCRAAAAAIGDHAAVHLVDKEGLALIPAALADPDEARRAERQRVLSDHPLQIGQGWTGRVVATGEPLYLPAVEVELLQARSVPEHRACMERLFAHGLMIVPMRARGRVLGALSLGRGTRGPTYTSDDFALLQEMADRAALAVEDVRLYAQAQEAIHARDEFLSVAAHELKTPVTGIKASAQLLARVLDRGTLDEQRLHRYVGSIVTGADRLATLTNDLLDVARIQTGRLTFEKLTFDLGDLLRDVVDRFSEGLDLHDRIQLELPPRPGIVMADPGRLEQVLLNLLDNAVKYSPNGGPIVVSLRIAEPELIVEVRDRGIGLPPGSRETIFEPFGRAPNAGRHHLPGMGLGLYICRSIVERHGGRIWAESPGENKGTTLVVSLPIAPAEKRRVEAR